MNATYYPAATLKFTVLMCAVFLLGLASSLLAATQPGSAGKEGALASDKEIAIWH